MSPRRRRPSANCLMCGAPAEHWHHITGRDLDPKLEVPLCTDCHKFLHDDWYTAGIGKEDRPPTLLKVMELRHQRTGMFLARLIGSGQYPQELTVLGAHFAMWAQQMRQAILDAAPCATRETERDA